MTSVYPHAYFNDAIVPIGDAKLSVASAAVLYGLSVYTVFPIIRTGSGWAIFRASDHFTRLINSAKIIGIDTFAPQWSEEKFIEAVRALVAAQEITADRVFVRATVHVDALVPGTRSRGLSTALSMFLYDANPILPQNGARVKTSLWRRIPDYVIPSRAKVNGAYINSVLGKQDALDSGYDDCIFLDVDGHVSELSAANIFLVRDGVLVTPGRTSDILEGINRKTILDIATTLGIPTEERTVDLTELYIADEVFACGTSAFIAPITQVDARTIGSTPHGVITQRIKTAYDALFTAGDAPLFTHL